MKKFILMAFMACTAIPQGMAQTDSTEISALRKEVAQLKKEMNQEKANREESKKLKGIWDRKNKYTLFYGSQNLTNVDFGLEYKSQFNAGINVALANIRFHSKPIANTVMLGMQLAMDYNATKYEKNVGIEDEISGGSFEEDLLKEELSSIMGGIDLMQMDMGLRVMPTVTVAPFATLGVKGLDALKVETGYGLIPSYTMLINDGDIVSGFGLYNSFHIGLAWKFIGVGYEHRWGSSDLKRLQLFDDDEDDDYDDLDNSSNTKQKHKQKANRVYLRFYF